MLAKVVYEREKRGGEEKNWGDIEDREREKEKQKGRFSKKKNFLHLVTYEKRETSKHPSITEQTRIRKKTQTSQSKTDEQTFKTNKYTGREREPNKHRAKKAKTKVKIPMV